MAEQLEAPAYITDRADPAAGDQLFAALYHELHLLAHRALSRRNGPPSMNTTVLLHEVYLSLARREGVSFPDEKRFLAYAARAIRGLAIDAIRRNRAQKRGSEFEITRLDTISEEQIPNAEEVTRLDAALDELAEIDPQAAELVELKYFCGLTLIEIAVLRDVSERTMQREWQKARLLLFDLLTRSETP